MPISIEEKKTPKGQRLMLAKVSGHVSYADAESMGNQLKPGQPFHQALVLCVVDKSTDYHPDARRHFNTFNGNYKKLATVVTSVLIRAAINFMMRVSGVGQDAVLFNTEADALAWLDG
ncbi:MAG TPA: STAS/SEC14 domain-containing protein [Pseudomonadota bacterium]|jgi:hypothetical protein|nr:STAS/SEC14 domain-containing protein [Pseudomonadota bacterium]HNF95689.1 STAS/SEC14 domain-containing protein [Pseudomonadota bacterium]HNK45102.1 STAS/SEC14 domain-containing protein [Pseudomonadota bacterium]HNN50637.1 STAS/SEC14 domain-containing protein [Pseudomonadota bacterium]HNO66874.1 STAS/SEC14 domain-containing protein [Pseudomonadota bacterium]